ncbi:hypothetical protein L3Y34_003995 [Caenorhabditis briggsae]|uniref:Uncharacterized protein n=1 Tax=Caenorhabditis briggsae TaxID=6238 RepID=A0AAE9AAT5_CAEBR|nr:hypothetical protein L3Y34_003995 [Caenorhabditis briggsae]
MYFFFVLNILFIVVVGIGCKKKNNAIKLQPRDMSKEKKSKEKVTPNGAGSKPATPTSPNPEDEKVTTPDPEKDKSMIPRDADDNETINEAKSCWSTLK